MIPPTTKVQPDHLQRLAYIYVRQSSLAQVQEHQESTRRQYELQQRAWQLGWAQERIVVVDVDLGHSASDPHTSRGGFDQFVTRARRINAQPALRAHGPPPAGAGRHR